VEEVELCEFFSAHLCRLNRVGQDSEGPFEGFAAVDTAVEVENHDLVTRGVVGETNDQLPGVGRYPSEPVQRSPGIDSNAHVSSR
jgi:hypothetical protein